MAGKFADTAYESDAGFVCKIRMSAFELAATTASASAIDAGFHCLNSGSRRRFGVHPRGVVLTRAVGAAPNEFNKSTFLAYPTVAGFNAIADGAKVTIDGVEWTVARKLPESLA